eukprot:TRINITY_DN726_c0_g2_i1.p1 TRINITY_DN726_c0_g2~~TRINITY_DN726_c0_g2_i1.p1  ORF type:complete len:252 (+),score=46.33 TRINITY_DN726_c0_g2_i1:427-1182(+)
MIDLRCLKSLTIMRDHSHTLNDYRSLLDHCPNLKHLRLSIQLEHISIIHHPLISRLEKVEITYVNTTQSLLTGVTTPEKADVIIRFIKGELLDIGPYDDALLYLKNHPINKKHLRSLTLRKVDRDVMKNIMTGAVNYLQRLRISFGSTQLGSDGLLKIVDGCRFLSEVVIKSSSSFDIRIFKRFHFLNCLDLWRDVIGGSEEVIDLFQSCPYLEHCTIYRLTDESGVDELMDRLMKMFPSRCIQFLYTNSL